MKTTMQELWDYVKEDKENINFIVYGKLRNKIIPLLEKEKEQINNAYCAGYKSGYNQGKDIDYYEEA
jgi:hypothetical protein